MSFMASVLICSVASADGWQDFSPDAKFAVQNAVMRFKQGILRNDRFYDGR
jgi:hypothetical protein